MVFAAAPAQAWGPIGPLTKENLKMGTKVGATGVSMFGRFSNPVGWAITAGTIGWWAYGATDGFTTIDIPGWDLDHYREMDPNYNGPIGAVPTVPSTYASALMEADVHGEGRNLVVHLRCLKAYMFEAQGYTCSDFGTQVTGYGTYSSSYVASQTDWNANHWGSCKNSTTNVVRWIRPNFGANSAGGNGAWVTRTITLCNAGEVLDGFYLAASKAPANAQMAAMSWGTLQPTLPVVEGDVGFGKYEVDVTCKNWQTQAIEHLTSYTMASDGGAVLPSCAGRLGEDWRAIGLKVAPAMPEIDNEPIPNEIEVPDFLPLEWDELLPEDPDWQPSQESKKGTALDIWIDGARCYESLTICRTWTKLAEKEPTRVKCQWGTSIISLAQCNVLKDFYKPDTEVITGTETSTPTTGTTDTTTGTTTGTTTATDTSLKTPENETTKGVCFPSGWGLLNPIDWVYKPVKCALTWGFVPTTPMSARLSRMKDRFANKAPFKWIESMAVIPASIPTSGCPNWRIQVGNIDRNIICGTPFGDAMRSARPVFTVMVLGAAFWPLFRSVMYASVPIIKPVPTNG